MTEPTLTMGRLARAAAVNIETVRYYQARKPFADSDSQSEYVSPVPGRTRRAHPLHQTRARIRILLGRSPRAAAVKRRDRPSLDTEDRDRPS